MVGVEVLEKQLLEAAEVTVGLVFQRIDVFLEVNVPVVVAELHDVVVQRARVQQALQHRDLEAGVVLVYETDWLYVKAPLH